MGIPRRLPAVLLLFALAACAAPQTARVIESPGDLPRRAMVETVPFFPQQVYYCGPAALAMTLTWSGLAETPESLAPQVYTRSEEHTSELPSLMRISYAGFCLKKKKKHKRRRQ